MLPLYKVTFTELDQIVREKSFTLQAPDSSVAVMAAISNLRVDFPNFIIDVVKVVEVSSSL